MYDTVKGCNLSSGNTTDASLVNAFVKATSAFSLREAASKVGVSHDTVRRWRQGEYGELRPDTRRALKAYIETRVRERAAAYGDQQPERDARADAAYIDQRVRDILGAADLDAIEKSALMLDLALILRAEALRDHGRTARLQAEEAVSRRSQLATERKAVPRHRSELPDDEERRAG